MKKANIRRTKRRKVYINRLNKLMRAKQKNKKGRRTGKIRIISNYCINNEYTSNKVVKLLNYKKFQEAVIKKGEKAKITIPEIFSFSENVDETIDIAFFSMEEIQKLSIDQKLEIYIHLKKGEHLTKYRFNKIYQMYVKSGKIVESGYPKKELVETVLQELKNENIDTVEKIDNILNTARYYRLGKYYALPIGNNPINTVIFDEEGKMIEGEEIYYYPTRDEEIDNKSNIELLSRHFSEDNVELITEQLKEKFKQYQTAYKGECKECGVTIIGNIIRLNYEYYDKKDETSHLQVDFYSVDDNGNLQLIPKRRKVQNYR